MRRTAWSPVVRLMILVGSTLFSCSRQTVTPPIADHAQSLPAQRSFASIRITWEQGTKEDRRSLRGALMMHIRAFQEDPTARSARGMLALIALQEGKDKEASRLAEAVGDTPPSVSADMATVVRGGVLRRGGGTAQALTLLRPLFGKTLDRACEEVLSEELARAAFEARLSADALKYLDAWIRSSGEAERERILQEAKPLLARLSEQELLQFLKEARSRDEWELPLPRIAAATVATIAIDRQDQRLARQVVDVAGPILGDLADATARVAARDGQVRLERNTTGFLLSLRTDELRRRGIEAARGLAFALGLPGSTTRLLTRDDQGDVARVDEGLSLLSADGASVLVAGLDTQSADVALAFAERTEMPVLLLRAPTRTPRPDGSAFVVGLSEDEGRQPLLSELLASGRSRIALLVAERSERAIVPGLRSHVVAVQPCGAALEFLRVSKADGLALDGDPACAAAVAGEVPMVVRGIDAVGPGKRLTAGIFGKDRANELRRATEDLGGLPLSYWTAVGRDAGVLAKKAVASPEGATSGLGARKTQIVELLGSGTHQLWSTDSTGFAGARKLARTLRIEDFDN